MDFWGFFETIVHYTKIRRGVVALCANDTESIIKFQLWDLFRNIWLSCPDLPRNLPSSAAYLLLVLPK